MMSGAYVITRSLVVKRKLSDGAVSKSVGRKEACLVRFRQPRHQYLVQMTITCVVVVNEGRSSGQTSSSVLSKDCHLDTLQNYLVHRMMIRNDTLKNINLVHIWKDKEGYFTLLA